jgi:parallel beta-helix repeat protein
MERWGKYGSPWANPQDAGGSSKRVGGWRAGALTQRIAEGGEVMIVNNRKIILISLLSLAAMILVLFLMSLESQAAETPIDGVPSGDVAIGDPHPLSASTTCTVTSPADDDSSDTLRWCLSKAEAGDIITFSKAVFPPSSPATITITSGPLPKIITDGLTIDGSGAGVIIDGHVLTKAHGLRIAADSVTIRKLQIVNFGYSGIRVFTNSKNTTIEGNTISGNHNDGIRVEGSNITGALIQGNVIGGNVYHGIRVQGNGITGTRILNNSLGTDASGTAANGNTFSGISVKDGPSNTLIQGNVIAANDHYGVTIWEGATSTVVISNSIGTDASGSPKLGNKLHGIIIRGRAQGNIIGPGNVIAYNGWDGVCVTGTKTLSNKITRNSITANDGLGIDNVNGGNGELRPPIITLVTSTTIGGQAQPGAIIELFTDPFFEGQQFITSTKADMSGTFTATLTTPLTAPLVTATSTDAAGNTSQFAAFCRLQDIWPDKIWPYCTTEPTPLSSPFGPRLMASQDYRYDFHRGVDLPAPLETPFYAITDGVVTKVVTDPVFLDGTIRIKHTDSETYYSHYRHVAQSLVITGQVVHTGTLIGSTGQSASGFAHLHFEIRDEPGGYEKYSVNPFGRMSYAATNDYEIEISGVYVDPTDPVSPTTVLLTVTGPRQELDLNRFTVSIDGSERVLDFKNLNQTKTPAPNNTTPDVLDNPYQNDICIMPARFNKYSDEYRIDLTFYDLPGSNSDTLTAEAADVYSNVVSTTTSQTAGGITISPDYAESWVSPGMTGTFTHTLANNTGATHTFTLTKASAQGEERWDVEVTPSPITLNNVESRAITVTVAISETVPIGTVDCIVVTAASEGEIQAIAVDVITASRIYLPIVMKNYPP